MTCAHERVHQFSTIYARTTWARGEDDGYVPEDAPLTKVLEEETTSWICQDCDAELFLEAGEDGRVVVEE